mmetsp:Transcript_22521/g.76574  ORF Transcript_22521/g.76574 Transcript_22521/m.76574 type:complete len:216 (-) Transcript_22521:803-1450(-)
MSASCCCSAATSRGGCCCGWSCPTACERGVLGPERSEKCTAPSPGSPWRERPLPRGGLSSSLPFRGGGGSSSCEIEYRRLDARPRSSADCTIPDRSELERGGGASTPSTEPPGRMSSNDPRLPPWLPCFRSRFSLWIWRLRFTASPPLSASSVSSSSLLAYTIARPSSLGASGSEPLGLKWFSTSNLRAPTYCSTVMSYLSAVSCSTTWCRCHMT